MSDTDNGDFNVVYNNAVRSNIEALARHSCAPSRTTLRDQDKGLSLMSNLVGPPVEVPMKFIEIMRTDPDKFFVIFLEIWVPLYRWCGNDGTKAGDYMSRTPVPALGKTIEQALDDGEMDVVVAWLRQVEVGGFA